MSSHRPALLFTGLGLVLAAVVAEVDRVFFSSGLVAFAAQWPGVLFHGLAVGVLAAGGSLLLFAPARRTRRDIKMDDPLTAAGRALDHASAVTATAGVPVGEAPSVDGGPRTDMRTAAERARRPSTSPSRAPPPTSASRVSPAPVQVPRGDHRRGPSTTSPPLRASTSAAASSASAQVPPVAPPRGPPRTSPAPAAAGPAAASPAASATRAPAPAAPPPAPPPSRVPDTTSDGPSPHIHRADEWLEHDDQALLDALQERRDRLKVEFALGKISAVGYERMRAKIDDEYAAIELRVAERQRY